MRLESNPALTAAELPELNLVAGDLAISGNAVLAVLELPNLAFVGGNMEILSNAALPSCVAEKLQEQLGPDNVGGSVTISGNSSAICD